MFSMFLTTSRRSAFNENLMKSKRWLIGGRPRLPAEQQSWEPLLTMTPAAQLLFMDRCTKSFVLRAKRVKVKAKARWTPEEWDKNADYATIYSKVLESAAETSVGEDTLTTIKDAFISGRDPQLVLSCTCHALFFASGEQL
jgi:hypothetical protein